MRDILLKSQVQVIFRKRENNLLRNMLCTLNREFIPPEEYTTYTSILMEGSADRIIAWDIEKNDWRSFYLDSVISYNVVQ